MIDSIASLNGDYLDVKSHGGGCSPSDSLYRYGTRSTLFSFVNFGFVWKIPLGIGRASLLKSAIVSSLQQYLLHIATNKPFRSTRYSYMNYGIV